MKKPMNVGGNKPVGESAPQHDFANVRMDADHDFCSATGLREQVKVREFRGKLKWEGDLEAMRTDK